MASLNRTQRLLAAACAVLLLLTVAGPASAARKPQPTSADHSYVTLADVVEQIGAPTLWADGFTGEGIDVAVIDTGITPVAALATPGKVIDGPDLSFDGGIEALAGLDGYGHGTHVAGIIAGHTPGADPLAPRDGDFLGVAPDARLVNVKVGDNTGAVDVSQVIAAIDWVVQNRNAGDLDIRVLNLSYNTDSSQDPAIDPLAFAVENAWNHGIVVVVAAGNDGKSSHRLGNPATNPSVIAVSSAQQRNSRPNGAQTWTLPSWAPSGTTERGPDLVAPGVSIASLRVPGSRIDEANPRSVVGDGLFLGSGTSQSAAVVAGAAALIIDQRPGITPDEVKALLERTAQPISGGSAFQGGGLIDLERAAATATPTSTQLRHPATGLGSLEASRGSAHVSIDGEELRGEVVVGGAAWDPETWSGTSWSGTSWSGTTWSGTSWSGTTWSGTTWSGTTWSGTSWSGTTWSGTSWSGTTWSGTSWSGTSWSGTSWSGTTWSGSTWSGAGWR